MLEEHDLTGLLRLRLDLAFNLNFLPIFEAETSTSLCIKSFNWPKKAIQNLVFYVSLNAKNYLLFNNGTVVRVKM